MPCPERIALHVGAAHRRKDVMGRTERAPVDAPNVRRAAIERSRIRRLLVDEVSPRCAGVPRSGWCTLKLTLGVQVTIGGKVQMDPRGQIRRFVDTRGSPSVAGPDRGTSASRSHVGMCPLLVVVELVGHSAGPPSQSVMKSVACRRFLIDGRRVVSDELFES